MKFLKYLWWTIVVLCAIATVVLALLAIWTVGPDSARLMGTSAVTGFIAAGGFFVGMLMEDEGRW